MNQTKEDLVAIVASRLAGLLQSNNSSQYQSLLSQGGLSFYNHHFSSQQAHNFAQSFLHSSVDSNSLKPFVREKLFGHRHVLSSSSYRETS